MRPFCSDAWVLQVICRSHRFMCHGKRRNGWLEQELAPDPTQVKWVLSPGSNRAFEYLNSGAIDIGSTAGLDTVLGKANGHPIRAVYIFSRPESTAPVVRKDSPIESVADLKSKKSAATKGTDPFLFTLRALRTAGVSRDDVGIVNLQHPDGHFCFIATLTSTELLVEFSVTAAA